MTFHVNCENSPSRVSFMQKENLFAARENSSIMSRRLELNMKEIDGRMVEKSTRKGSWCERENNMNLRHGQKSTTTTKKSQIS